MSGEILQFKPRAANPWAEYERLKKAWVNEHPGASNQAYQEAMKSIAKRLGI